MNRYRCRFCAYVYKPEKGQPAMGIKSNTPLEQLPPDWNCPVCGASKDDFTEVKEN